MLIRTGVIDAWPYTAAHDYSRFYVIPVTANTKCKTPGVLVEHPDATLDIASLTATTSRLPQQPDRLTTSHTDPSTSATTFSVTLPEPRQPSKTRACLAAAATSAVILMCGVGAAVGAYYGIRAKIGTSPVCNDTGAITAEDNGVYYTCSNATEVIAFADRKGNVQFYAFLAVLGVSLVSAFAAIASPFAVYRRFMRPQHPAPFRAA